MSSTARESTAAVSTSISQCSDDQHAKDTNTPPSSVTEVFKPGFCAILPKEGPLPPVPSFHGDAEIYWGYSGRQQGKTRRGLTLFIVPSAEGSGIQETNLCEKDQVSWGSSVYRGGKGRSVYREDKKIQFKDSKPRNAAAIMRWVPGSDLTGYSICSGNISVTGFKQSETSISQSASVSGGSGESEAAEKPQKKRVNYWDPVTNL